MIVGVGVDICHFVRMKGNKDKLAEKILSSEELLQFKNLKGKRQLEFLGGRFAAKEAIFKACKIKEFNKINIYLDEGTLKTNIVDYKVFISISHDNNYAVAYCVAEENT